MRRGPEVCVCGGATPSKYAYTPHQRGAVNLDPLSTPAGTEPAQHPCNLQTNVRVRRQYGELKERPGGSQVIAVNVRIASMHRLLRTPANNR